MIYILFEYSKNLNFRILKRYINIKFKKNEMLKNMFGGWVKNEI